MLTYLKNDEGYPYALIEWQMVDRYGNHIEKELYCLVLYSWIHEDYRGKFVLKELVYQMCQSDYGKNAQFVGWERGEKKRKLKWYPVHKILTKLFEGVT